MTTQRGRRCLRFLMEELPVTKLKEVNQDGY